MTETKNASPIELVMIDRNLRRYPQPSAAESNKQSFSPVNSSELQPQYEAQPQKIFFFAPEARS